MRFPKVTLLSWRARDFRVFVLAALADGRERTTTEITDGYSPIGESVYRAVKSLEAQGLVRIRKGLDGRLHLKIVYNPELYELDVLNTLSDDADGGRRAS